MASLSTSPARGPSGRMRPQWPWLVNSSRQVSAQTTTSSPTSARTAAIPRLRMPSSAQAAVPASSRVAGTPNRSMAPMPASAQAAASRRSESSVCWTTPGIASTGRGSSMSSRTNTGRMRAAGSTTCSRARRRIAGVVRRRRGRTVGACGSGTERRDRKSAAGRRASVMRCSWWLVVRRLAGRPQCWNDWNQADRVGLCGGRSCRIRRLRGGFVSRMATFSVPSGGDGCRNHRSIRL